MSAIHYQKVFSNLCHIKALSRDNKFDEIVQHIIVNVLYRCANELISTPDDIVAKISELYGIDIRLTIITSNTDKLLGVGTIEKTAQGGFFLPVSISEKIKANIDYSQELEQKIKANWISDLKTTFVDRTDDELEILWQGLQMYLVRIFEQHGVQTLNLLNPQNKSKDIEISTYIIVEQIVEKIGGFITPPILTNAINSFFHSADTERVGYLAQLADATFTSYALTTDQQTTEFLNSRYGDLDLFLDTNFIFGILGLHKNTEDTAAREILEETKKNRLPFRLCYHPETLDEFTRAFNAKANLIDGFHWTRETSRVALMRNDLSPIEKLYHETNIDHEIDPRIFLEKYDHIGIILKDLGLIEHPSFHNIVRDQDELADIELDIQAYENYYNQNPIRQQKHKSYLKFKHDIVVVRDVRALNPKKTKFLKSRAFFISSDYVLAKFERIKFVKKFEIEYVISPSVFLQLIRPFISSDFTSNKRFVETFTIPEFRASNIDYSNAKSIALQIINDQFHGATLETKVKILSDQMLIEKMELSRGNGEERERQVDLIENFVAQQNTDLTEQNAELSKGIAGFNIREKVLQEELQRTKDELERKTREAQEYPAKLQQWEDARCSFVDDKIDRIKKQYRSDSHYMLITLGIILITEAALTAALIPVFPNCLEKWMIACILTFIYLTAVVLTFMKFLHDKERVKNGWKWVKPFRIKKQQMAILSVHRAEYEKEFETKTPKPSLIP